MADRTIARDFATARDGQDLVPGNPRAITAVSDGLGVGAASVTDATSDLARTTTTVLWSGTAADAFAAHRRAVINCTDRWDEALDMVRAALEDQYQDAVSAAQHTAAEGLGWWRQARTLAAQAPRWDTPTANLAANADAMRAQLQALINAATHKAAALLTQARTDLTQAGDHATQTVSQALDILRRTPLPTRAQTPAGTDAQPATTQPHAWRPPGWAGHTVTVQPPHDGVHDSLSRIAARELGDANRWHQIWQLNVGQPVGPHAVLTDPNRIQPGWTLRLPDATPHHATAPIHCLPPATLHPHTAGNPPTHTGHHVTTGPLAGHRRRPAGSPPPGAAGPPPPAPPGIGLEPPVQPHPGPPGIAPPHNAHPAPAPAPTPAPAVTGSPVHVTGERSVNLGGGLVLAGGVAAGLATLAVIAGLRHHASAGHTPQPATPAAPVVRRLTAALPDHAAPTPSTPRPAAAPAGPPPPGGTGVPAVGFSGRLVPLGHRDGRAVLYDIAATRGLGLTGPGARGAARALLISTLVTNPAATAVLPDPDRRRLLADPATSSLPATGRDTQRTGGGRVTITASLDVVLDHVEADLLTRTRLLEEHQGRWTPPPLVIITTRPADTGRLQAVADLGAGLGIAVVVLGEWPAGITCEVTSQGRVMKARGQQVRDWNLPGLRLFTAGTQDALDLLALLNTVSTQLDPTSDARDRTVIADTPARTADDTRDGGQQPLPGTPPHPSTADRRAPAEAGDHPGPAPGELARRLNPHPLPTTPAHGEIARRLNTPAESSDTTNTPDTGDPGTRETTSAESVHIQPGVVPTPRRAPRPARATPATSDPIDPSTNSNSGAGRTGPVLPSRVLALHVFGPLRLEHQPRDGGPREITSAIGPRLRELLAYLAVHPDGVRRDELVDALWPDTNPDRHTHALNAATTRLRRALARATDTTVTELIRHDDQRLHLDTDLVIVDLWRFQHAWDAARAATDTAARAAAYQRMIDTYGGRLADDVDADWIAAPRHSVHRAATDAVAGLARLLVPTDPHRTLHLLDSALTWDPYNEHLYRDIMRLQAQLGQVDAIARTLDLLGVRLKEISAAPTAETRALAAGLQQRANTTGPTRPAPAPPRPRTPGHSGQASPGA